MTDKMKAVVLRVGDGRGFVVVRRGYRNHEERIVITAAHCLAYSRLANGTEGLPPSHPGRYLEEETYRDLLGLLEAKPTVWAKCLFVDPIADIAVLGQPDNQDLSEYADAYDALMDSATTLPVADAPAQGTEMLTFGDYRVENPTPAGSARRRSACSGIEIGDARALVVHPLCGDSVETDQDSCARRRLAFFNLLTFWMILVSPGWVEPAS